MMNLTKGTMGTLHQPADGPLALAPHAVCSLPLMKTFMPSNLREPQFGALLSSLCGRGCATYDIHRLTYDSDRSSTRKDGVSSLRPGLMTSNTKSNM
jgi:hypothetical protein